MGASFRSCVLAFFLLSIFASASAQTCSSYTFSNNAVYTTCLDLPNLNSFLHWTYNQTSGALQVAFRRPGTTSSTWVAWALNFQGTDMAGAQSLVAYQNSTGVRVYTTPISGYGTTLAEGDLSFGVSRLTGTYISNEMAIFATLQLNSGLTTVNHIWQEGPLSGGVPAEHSGAAANTGAKGTLNLLTGDGTTTGNSRLKKRHVHGVLNAVSWGTLMPIGAIIARYLKVFKSADPAWFYLHVACQSSAYAVGVAGWATGLKLGSESAGLEFTAHRNIGITLFVLGTLQVFALLLRPNKDHKFRFYWNIYHHSIGYMVIILSVVNVYKGFEALDSQENWKRAYTAIIIVLGCIAVCLEAFTWFIVLKRKRAADKFPHTANGVNGHGARSPQMA